jgi:hypothetical protein
MPTIPAKAAATLLGVRGFHQPIVPPETLAPETPSVSFADLVRMLAEGIADAQASLDRTSAELVEELANTKVRIVPEVREIVDEEGHVTYEEAEPREVSLLSLGVTPTFYQFSQSTVEVVMDIKLVEEEKGDETGKRRLGLFAGTADVRAERRLNRDVSVHSKLTTTLVPVPMPMRLEPSRAMTGPGA